MGREITLERNALISLMTEDAFYKACPSFIELQSAVVHPMARYRKSQETSCCGGDVGILFPSTDRFIELLNAATPETVAALKTHLSSKKGFVVDRIYVYYRKSMKGAALRLRF